MQYFKWGDDTMKDFVMNCLRLREVVEDVAELAYKADNESKEQSLFQETAKFGENLANMLLGAWAKSDATKSDSGVFVLKIEKDRLVGAEFQGGGDWSNLMT